jgi:hypothetical protein
MQNKALFFILLKKGIVPVEMLCLELGDTQAVDILPEGGKIISFVSRMQSRVFMFML